MPHCRCCGITKGQTRWRAGKATCCFGEGLLCNECITVSKQPMRLKGPCDTCSITGAPGWHRSGNMKICRWCYPCLPVITPGMTLSNVQNSMLGLSVLPELTNRRNAWEQAHGLAAQSSAWPSEHSEEVAHSQPNDPAVDDDKAVSNVAPSIAAPEAAACELSTVDRSPSLISNRSLDNATAEEPATDHLQTPSIVQKCCKRYQRAGMSSLSADESNSRLLDCETSHDRDKGKKSAASVTDKHISEVPRPNPSDESGHPKQPGDQQENGDGTGRVKKLTGRRSRKRSSVDVHQKSSQRQRCQSASRKDPEQSPLQAPGLAGVPKPQRYRDINTLTMELRLADRLPRECQNFGHAVGGRPQESVPAAEGATRLLSVCTKGRQPQQQLRQQPQQQPDQPEQGNHSRQADQQTEAQGHHDAHRLNQQKQLFQAQLDAQNALLKEFQQDAADKGERLAQETAALQALRLERESYLDLAIQQQEHIFVLEQEAVERQQGAAQLQQQQQEEQQKQQIAAALKFKAELRVMKQKRRVSITKNRKSRDNLRTLLADERAGAVRQQDALERLAAAQIKLVKGQLSYVKSRTNRHLCKLQSKLNKNRTTPKQTLEWGVQHLEAVLADPKWLLV
ncbi:TPA: hypothetical protein ACH3X1_012805 [Trebouxia sp. C0004]